MFENKLEQSPNWEKYKDLQAPIEEGFPFHEGFPKIPFKSFTWPYVDPFLFTLITQDGEKHIAMVNTSGQYKAEGLRWNTYPERKEISKYIVVAWKELNDSEYLNNH